ncbi:MAG: hypothetical protein J1F42_05325 [Lachnospiraceae bacterium]|nr:hypothetical protein [Lachnospiraceae bacterium]
MRKIDNFYRLLFTGISIYLIVLMLRYPALSLEYAATGLNLWLTKMVPTLLPFMILSGIMIRMELTENFVTVLHPLLHRLFGTSKNGSYTIIMGFLCGFPMGARIVGELCESGRLSREESSKLLYFCNNIGPIYFLSYVIPVLGIKNPLIPLLIMYGIPLLYGFILFRIPLLLFRLPIQFHRRNTQHSHANILSVPNSGDTANDIHKTISRMSLPAAIDSSVLSGLIGIAKLGGYMVFFNLLNIVFVPFRHVSTDLLNLYQCILEITSGINHSGQSLYYPILILLPFGGFSCIAQTYSMISRTDLSVRSYIFHKVVQTALTALCYLIIYFL